MVPSAGPEVAGTLVRGYHVWLTPQLKTAIIIFVTRNFKIQIKFDYLNFHELRNACDILTKNGTLITFTTSVSSPTDISGTNVYVIFCL